ncbi:hypothetical protein LPMP_201740 [Leishmania panamensis]|uniref:ABC3 transporter permease C-terminal domain-containing protein n=1 Tax=Leishmania panamensis TaxID=5679 RepID=A0A088RP23_LEIPA|nr:hypothetical protein LPMP_201740 [Leishmania panamensis]AIN97668.1 hypothetical protein LPMP_201740 [Leishmania panamensis]
MRQTSDSSTHIQARTEEGTKMAAARLNHSGDLSHFSAGRSPASEQLEITKGRMRNGTTGPNDIVVALNGDRKESSLDGTNDPMPIMAGGLEDINTIHTLTSNRSVPKRVPLKQNRRLAVDLAFNDEAPSTWTTFRRIMHNIWTSVKMMRLFLSLAWTDAKARTCSYCLGFFSVLVVVLLCVLMISLLVHMPIVFLRLSEETNGEYDLQIVPGGVMEQAMSINYSVIKELFPESDPEYGYNAPRLLDMYRARTTWSCPNKTLTRMWYNADGSVCSDIDSCMSSCLPNGTAIVGLVAIDAAAEARMGLGTDYNQPTLNEGEVILSHRASILMGEVNVGDMVILYGNAQASTQFAVSKLAHNDSAEVIMMFKVISIMPESQRKFPGMDAYAIVSFQTFLRDLSKGLGPYTSAAGVEGVANTNPNECASAVYFIMNPATRLKVYSPTNYNRIRSNVVAWSSRILSSLGLMQINAFATQLPGLFSTRLFSVFTGLTMSVILLALAFLSVVLIYTLLTVGVETKKYELGIQRMVGLTKENLIFLVLTNAYAFTLPAWLIGLVAGQGAYTGIRFMFLKLVNVELPMFISGASVGWATLAGLGIPIVASFFPILSLVSQSLPDAINTSRSRNSGVIYKIQRKDSTQWSGPMFALGVLFFVFGFLVYYLFPTALITMNLALIFYIFFGVLIGLLAGFVLLAMNFERVAQTSISYLLLFWESKAVFSFMQKSLSAHRRRNRKTSLMYALSLAFIIFITVVVQIQLISFEYSSRQSLGCEMIFTTRDMTMEEYWAIEEILEKQKEMGIISAYTYDYNSSRVSSSRFTKIISLGRLQSSRTTLRLLSPNYFEVMDSQYLKIDNFQSIIGRYGLVQSLYSPEGLYKGIMSSGAAEHLGVGNADGVVLLERGTESNVRLRKQTVSRTTVRPLATLDLAPAISMSKYSTGRGDLVVSIPGLFRQLNVSRMSVLSGRVGRLRLRVKDPQWFDYLDDLLTRSLFEMGRTATVRNIRDVTSNVASAANLLNLFFIITQIMIMLICFFSLMSSMTSNVFDSSKEVGVLLCLGMSHFQVYRVYIWEAFVLVVSSGILGLIVGLIVAYTMQLQNVLFTELPLPFPFPYIQLCILVGMGFVSALASSISPVAYLLSLPSVTHILRRVTH